MISCSSSSITRSREIPPSSAERTTAASSAPSSRSSSARRPSRSRGRGSPAMSYALSQIMPLVDEFQEILDALPSDWTDMELDLRVQEDRYVDAAALMVTCNAQPYSNHDWHFHIIVAHRFGHAAAAPVVHGTLRLLDEAGIGGELVLRE